MNKLVEPETIWLAAILEGEGSFTHKRPGSPSVKMQMTDEDVVRRAHQFAGVGTVSGPHTRKDYKLTWTWHVQNRQDAAMVMLRVLPFMGHRRQKKILELLAEYEGR